MFGWPDNPDVPPAISFDKFEAFYNHLHKLLGRKFDTRNMTVGMMPYK